MDKPSNAVSPAMLHARRRSSAYVIALSCVAALGGFLFGFDSGVINGAVDALAKAFGTQAAGTGFAVASVLLGCAVGAFSAGTLADSIGRRPTMLLNAILFLVSAVATGAAPSGSSISRGCSRPSGKPPPSGHRVSQGASCGLRGRMLLALMPGARDSAQGELGMVEREAGGKRRARPLHCSSGTACASLELR